LAPGKLRFAGGKARFVVPPLGGIVWRRGVDLWLALAA